MNELLQLLLAKKIEGAKLEPSGVPGRDGDIKLSIWNKEHQAAFVFTRTRTKGLVHRDIRKREDVAAVVGLLAEALREARPLKVRTKGTGQCLR